VLRGASRRGGTSAQDWPQWRGVGRDARVAGFKAPASWPEELSRQWKVTVGDGTATPALVGDKLYVFSREDGSEVLRCLDAATGKERWRDKYESGAATGAAKDFAGPRSSPAVADGKVVTLGVRGVLSCYDAATGRSCGGRTTSRAPCRCSSRRVRPSSWAASVSCSSAARGATTGGAPGVRGVRPEDRRGEMEVDSFQAGPSYNASSPAVAGRVVFYSGPGTGTRAVKVEEKGRGLAAQPLWTNKEVAAQYNTLLVKDGLVYGLSDRDE
jgi:outer membrane protein assembly factor BamB